MNLRGIVAVGGKPGLWKVLTQNKNGFVLESLDAQKTKLIANISTAKLAALEEITIFGAYDDIKLKDVFERMKGAKNVPDVKDGKAMREYFREVAPDHDEEKVYASDMKKIIGWFGILKDMPLFNEVVESPVAPDEVPAAVEETKEPVVKQKAKTPETEKPVAEKAPKKKKASTKKAE